MDSMPIEMESSSESSRQDRVAHWDKVATLTFLGLSLCAAAWVLMQFQMSLWSGFDGPQVSALVAVCLVVAYLVSRVLMRTPLRFVGFLLGTSLLGIGLGVFSVFFLIFNSMALIPITFVVLVVMQEGGRWVRSGLWRRWCAPLKPSVPAISLALRVMLGLQFLMWWRKVPTDPVIRVISLWMRSGYGNVFSGVQVLMAALLALFTLDAIEREEPATSATEAALMITESLVLWAMAALLLTPRLLGHSLG